MGNRIQKAIEEKYLREDVEWTNTWISKANSDSERCLLIGDSVTRNIRRGVEYFVGEWLAIDFFGGSFDILDNMFWNHLYCFFQSGYKYKIIILNYSFHHGGNIIGCKNKVFKEYYMRLLKICMENSEHVVFMSGTSWNKEYSLYKECEREILLKNSILMDLAKINRCIFIDLHKIMNDIPFTYIDKVHFEEKANAYISGKIIEELFEKIFDLEWRIYRETKREKIYENYSELNKFDKVYIYGNGKNGHLLYFLIKFYMWDLKILGWCVSKREEITWIGIPIFSINNLPSDDLVIVPNGLYTMEMVQYSKDHGHNNILVFDI